MIKPYGFKMRDLTDLAAFIKSGGLDGGTLTDGLKVYAIKSGKAFGSVRNLYYALAKYAKSDAAFSAEHLCGKQITVAKPREFSQEEKSLLNKMKEQVKRGVSVRAAAFSVAGGDAVKALRFQNKYRNISKGAPANKAPLFTAKDYARDFSFFRLKKEINALIERLSSEAAKENAALKKEIFVLRSENRTLYRKLREKERGAADYFSRFAALPRPSESER